MPKIDADAPLTDGFMRSSIVYGVSRAGKSVFNATFPRPAIFCSEREGGYKSVQTMDRSLWYERNMKPIIFAVSSMKETMPYFKEVEADIRRGRIQTVVLELSFYSDDVVKAAPTDEKNGWAKYKLLDDHISWLDAAIKRLGVRVAYNALAVDPGDLATKAPAGVQLAGKSLARKLPASTDLTGYLRTEDKGSGNVDRVLHLGAYGAYPAGHRYGSRLPTIVRNATYRKLEDLMAGRAHVDDEGNVLSGEAPPKPAAQQQAAESEAGDLPPL